MKNSIQALAAVIVSSLLASSASAQLTDSQTYSVTVPSNISIVAPVDVAITHDETDSNQSFPIQAWSVVGNSVSGVTVSFAAATPFTHTTDPTYKRDAQLGLAVQNTTGPGTWTITKASDTTDYDNGDDAASVTAASNGTSSATFNLAVSFITDTYGSFPSGSYETEIVGTVTAN